jgi:hypothetical protein
MSTPPAWRNVLAQQDQVISRSQALLGGLSRHQWSWKLDHDWQLAVPGVAVAHTGGTTPRQRAWVAALHGGKDAVVSGDAALRLLGLKVEGSTIDVAVPLDRRARDALLTLDEPDAVAVHRVKGLAAWRRDVRGLPMTHAHAAVLLAVSWAPTDRAAEWRIAAAVQRRITSVPSLREVLEQMPALKRRALIREVLDDVELGAHAASELRFLRFLRTHGLPMPDALQLKVRAGRVHYLDARYERQRVTVEVDGTHHRAVETWEADALRTLRLVAALPGERVVRVTMGLIRNDGEEVAGLLRRILV